MPLVVDEERLEQNPDLLLAQYMFELSSNDNLAPPKRSEMEKYLMDSIKRENMGPFYKNLCGVLSNVQTSILFNEAFFKEMSEKNEDKIKEFDAYIEDAEKNLTEMEVREHNLRKSEYLCRIGDLDGAIVSFEKTFEKTVSLGQKLDIIFHLIRIGLFLMDHSSIPKNIERAKGLIDEGGDWDRRNRLKVYQGTYGMCVRDFKTASSLFLDTISTFTSYELMDYSQFVSYTVISSMIALPRNELREKILKGAEIQEVLHSPSQGLLKSFLDSLYNSKYGQFFSDLAAVEEVLKTDRFLSKHYRYYVREMRVKAYSQLLESYSSLTLTYMADAFGVSVEFIDRELHRFIAAGRLHCKIDKVLGVVETNRPDSKNAQYQSTIKQGDILLNRIQKLSRVINI